MGYSNGQVQSLSDSGKAQKGDPGLPGIGFYLTDDGNFDLDGKRLTDVADPVDNGDAATKGYVDTKNSGQNIAINSKAEKAYVDTKNSQQNIAINSKAEKTDVILRDGSQSMNANLNLNNKKITNLGDATSDGDAVNFSQLKTHTDSHLNNYHLQPSFTFYRNFGNEGKVPRSTRIKLFSNHNHHGLNWVKKEGSDSGFGGQAWVSLKMTNNLPVGIYMVVFELFSGISGISGSVTQLNNETLLQQVRGDANYKIISFSRDYQTTHSKAFIQFTSNGQAGEITFQIRYYGSSYNNSTLNFLFFSRVLAERVGTAINHALFDVDDVQLKNQILYFEDVNLNENKLKNIAPAEDYSDAVNLRQIIDIYQPYVYELNNFQFYKKNNKLNPINVTIRPDLPADNIIRKHNHHVVYITNFFSGIWSGPNYISSEHSFRNLNLDAGDYTFILEIITEVYRQPNNYSKNNVFLVGITANNGITSTKNEHQYVDNEYNKVVLQFNSNGTNNGRINFKFQKNNRKYDNI